MFWDVSVIKQLSIIDTDKLDRAQNALRIRLDKSKLKKRVDVMELLYCSCLHKLIYRIKLISSIGICLAQRTICVLSIALIHRDNWTRIF